MTTIQTDLEQVVASQLPSGAFPSTVHFADRHVADENGFVTALVLNELSRFDEDALVRQAIERGLEFLVRCEVPGRDGHFCFYPIDAHPVWMTTRLRPDADDTALFAVLLARYGRRPQSFLAEVVNTVLSPFQMLYLSERSKPWYRCPVYFTWLDERLWPNDIDCCVNVNVLTLIHRSGTVAAGRPEIVAMIHRALDWAGESIERATILSPWYPHPIELYYAVNRAVRSGVEELQSAAAVLRDLAWVKGYRRAGITETPICGSADRRFVWTSEVLQLARQLP